MSYSLLVSQPPEDVEVQEDINEWDCLGVPINGHEQVLLIPTNDKCITIGSPNKRVKTAKQATDESTNFLLKLEYSGYIPKKHLCYFCRSPAQNALEVISCETEQSLTWCESCWNDINSQRGTLEAGTAPSYVVNICEETREFMSTCSLKCIFSGLGCSFTAKTSNEIFEHLPNCSHRVLRCFLQHCTYSTENLVEFVDHIKHYPHDQPYCIQCCKPLTKISSRVRHYEDEINTDGYLTYKVTDSDLPDCSYHSRTWHERSYQCIIKGGFALQCLRLKDGVGTLISLPIVTIINAPLPAVKDGAIWAASCGVMGFAQGVAAGQYVGIIAGAEAARPLPFESFWRRIVRLSVAEFFCSITGMVVGATAGFLTYTVGGALIGMLHGAVAWPRNAVRKAFSKSPAKYELQGIVNPDLCEPWTCCQRQGMNAEPCITQHYHICRLKEHAIPVDQ